ncbi:MAG: GNAT family N-acetyltransferase [Acidimicrobiia bacterium]|nr:GNAT family N-acetyltransferase [Acidimicrobiia bacterium]
MEDILGHEIVWLGAFAEDKLVGGIGYADRPGYRDIDRLFVDPGFARRGIGRALVLSALGNEETRVSTGTANHPAHRLYESLGFTPAGVREIAPGVTVTSLILQATG